jgi:hypothetical protein
VCINIALFLVLKRLPPKNGCVRKANLQIFTSSLILYMKMLITICVFRNLIGTDKTIQEEKQGRKRRRIQKEIWQAKCQVPK